MNITYNVHVKQYASISILLDVPNKTVSGVSNENWKLIIEETYNRPFTDDSQTSKSTIAVFKTTKPFRL